MENDGNVYQLHGITDGTLIRRDTDADTLIPKGCVRVHVRDTP